jgi:ribonuclease HI
MNIMRTERKHNGVQIFTDGGCHGNPGPGGWAFIYTDEGHRVERSGFEAETTNNRMELTAVIRALEYAEERGRGADSAAAAAGKEMTIYTDSQYVQKGISEWIHSWVQNNWKTAAKKPVKNKDLWVRLQELSDRCTPRWMWVRGHAGTENNEKCDLLVQKVIKNHQI